MRIIVEKIRTNQSTSIFTLYSKFIEVDECAHVLWKADDDIKQGLKFFKQREAILLDTKLRYFRENRYLRETKKTR